MLKNLVYENVSLLIIKDKQYQNIYKNISKCNHCILFELVFKELSCEV